jgi:two-component system, cell cycle sensor histidine kinase and response regulator CckA
MSAHGQDAGEGAHEPEHAPVEALPLAEVERLADVGHWSWDPAADTVRWSSQTAAVFGVDPTEAPTTYEGYLAFLHPDDREIVVTTVERVLAVGGPFTYEHRLVRPDGDVRVVHCRGESRTGPDGRAVRLFGVVRDVTAARAGEDALRRAGEALAESESRFRQIAEHMSTGLWLYDTVAGRYLYINPAYTRITGQTMAALEADPRSWLEFVHPEDRPGVKGDVRGDEGRGFVGFEHEHRIVAPDGEVRWVRVRSDPVRDDTGRVYRTVGSMEDVTALRDAEAALRASETRFRRLAEGFPFILWMGDAATGATEYVNPAYARIFGRPLGALYDDPHDWLRAVHPEDRPRMEDALAEATREPGTHEQDYRILDADGAVRWMRWLSYRLTDEDGQPTRRVAVVEDVTDRRLLADELLQAQKMHAVGRLAGGVAHDFNNLLFVILNHLDEAQASLPTGSTAHADLGRAREAAERVSALTDQLLTFSRRRPTDWHDLDLAQAVRDTADMLHRTLGSDVEIRLDLPGDLPAVRLDPAQLQQVVVNLAVNARDAMPTGGTLTLAARHEDDPQHPGRTVVALRVSDTGEGMAPDVAARVFEPFYTTKPVGRGTGLGLSMVYGIVEQHGGHVLLDSAVGEGTTVSLLLPPSAASPVASGAPVTAEAVVAPPEQRRVGGDHGPDVPAGSPRPDGRGRVVLVVEDADDVRRAMVRVLARAGFATYEAARPDEAIRMCQHQVWAVDLLVTDVVMPGMSGADLVVRLAGLGLHPPVVLVSGYAREGVPEGLDGSPYRYLQKPFRAEQLLAAADELLGSGSR